MKSLEQSDIDFLDELSKLHYCQLYMPPHNKKNTPFFLLKDVKNVTYIDLDQDLSDEQGNLAKDLTVEGLHINANGYEVITRKIMPYLIKDKE